MGYSADTSRWFQSAPLTEARGDAARRISGVGLGGSFNPLPSPKQGETNYLRSIDDTQFVSIRSPHRSKGRPSARTGWSSAGAFQSAPLTEARGDLDDLAYAAGLAGFNPLPSPKQGETPIMQAIFILFQSAPLTEARGDQQARLVRVEDYEFQSAPLTEARGDKDSAGNFTIGYGFQSAPLTEARGDSAQGGYPRSGKTNVSIRSPHRSKGRPREAMDSAWEEQFQSAPLTEARGDRRGDGAIVGLVFVSIRSPHRSKGRLGCLAPPDPRRRVSIRSPHRSKGRRAYYSHCSGPLVQFQSAPLTEARGDITVPIAAQQREEVSIRSPHRSKGRHHLLLHSPAGYKFQSAPLTEARGDLEPPAQLPPPQSFQSAPLTEARGDRVRQRARVSQ